jgi:hypothetical protein
MRTHLTLLAIVAVIAVHGQWGVRGTILHFEQQTGRSGLNWLLGLDHDPTDRTSIGVDFISHINLSGESADRSESAQYGGYNVYYSIARSVQGLQFRSTYFLSGYGNAGFYMGTYAGFRSISLLVDPNVYNSVSGGLVPNWARRTTTTSMVFPVGLRWGLRSEMDTWYQDIYFAMGFQVGSESANATLPPFLVAKDQFKGFSLQAGYVFGFGW